MTVDPAAAAARSTYEGRTYYFCSDTCRKAFEQDPGRYSAAEAAPGPEQMERHEPPRTTTGKFTAPKFGSAGSGGAEYEPLPEAHDEKR
jgi:Cu+-exporting ATPase